MMDPGLYSFTERCHQVLNLAREAARDFGHDSVSPTHVALGLLREGEGVAVAVLVYDGVDLAALKRDLEGLLPPESAASIDPEKLSFGTEVRTFLSRARAESEQLGHVYVGTEHFLLAFARDADGPVAHLLAKRGIPFDRVLARVLWMLNPEAHEPPPPISAGAV